MVYFVGAGPGAVDLITVRGRELLSTADVIIYAGSLVAKEHLQFAKEGCRIFNSAEMTLEEVIAVISKNKDAEIVRLHTGDPTIYGAIREQMDALDELHIQYEVIPGVSSCTAAAAAIKKEFTLPDISQTIILTRMEGRTPVPQTEKLSLLAEHRASMAIFLSVQNIEKVVRELLAGYKDEATPVAIVYKASWEDEKIIFGTLANIAEKVKAEKINSQAQILVGDFIAGANSHASYSRSKLYDPGFSHGFRKSKNEK